MDKAAVQKLCIHEEEFWGWSSVLWLIELKASIEAEIQEERHFIDDRLHLFVCINDTSQHWYLPKVNIYMLFK